MTLTLYSKPGCHLCEEVRAVLDDLCAEFGYRIDEIDITADDGLWARYRYEIPVLMRDGVEIARGRLTERDLVTMLTSR